MTLYCTYVIRVIGALKIQWWLWWWWYNNTSKD